jgi:hypothetical protein
MLLFRGGEACNADLPACAPMADLLLLLPDQGVEQSAFFVRQRLPSFRRAADIPSPASFIRDELIRGFESLGYELVDSWHGTEHLRNDVLPRPVGDGLLRPLPEPGNASPAQGRREDNALPQSASASHYIRLFVAMPSSSSKHRWPAWLGFARRRGSLEIRTRRNGR